uniref:Small acidic protein n=1 Tax=Schistosoma japonicum TaxID=6182 RepID=C1LE90_SCHJA|nr:Small acidic protein [Schistosoma japonicum]
MESSKEDGFKLTDVRSPNDWEHVDLGSENRNKKFLKLMGGDPVREHKGKLVIGENIDSVHNQNKDSSVINKELENQYLQGLEKCTPLHRHHGLGCHTDPSCDPVDHLDYSNTKELKQQYTSSFVPKKDS